MKVYNREQTPKPVVKPIKPIVPVMDNQSRIDAIRALTASAKERTKDAHLRVEEKKREKIEKQASTRKSISHDFLQVQEVQEPINRLTTAYDIYEVYKEAMSEAFPKIPVNKWGAAELGAAKQLCKKYPTQDLKKVVLYGVTRWEAYQTTRNDFGGVPTIFGIVKHILTFINDVDDNLSPAEKRVKLIDAHLNDTPRDGVHSHKESKDNKPFNFEEW